MKWIFHKAIVSLVLLASIPSFANSQIHSQQYKGSITQINTDNSWFVGIGGGVYWANLSKSNANVPNGSGEPAPFNKDRYTIENPSRKGVQQVDAGFRWHREQNFIPYTSLYFQYRNYNSANITGSVYQYSLPEFLNYHYKNTYSAQLLTINGKLNLCDFKRIMPYVSGGVGAIINNLDGYSETPTANVTPRISPSFGNNSKTRFAGTLGAGLDFTLTHNVWLTLGYEHVFQSNLPRNSGQNTWTGTSLGFGNIKLDTVFLNISAKFPDTFRLNK